MSAIVNPASWAEQTFGPCQLGDQRRTNRLIQMAQRVIENPSGSLPDQMLDWAELKAAYRLFDADGVMTESRWNRLPCRTGNRLASRPSDVRW